MANDRLGDQAGKYSLHELFTHLAGGGAANQTSKKTPPQEEDFETRFQITDATGQVKEISYDGLVGVMAYDPKVQVTQIFRAYPNGRKEPVPEFQKNDMLRQLGLLSSGGVDMGEIKGVIEECVLNLAEAAAERADLTDELIKKTQDALQELSGKNEEQASGAEQSFAAILDSLAELKKGNEHLSDTFDTVAERLDHIDALVVRKFKEAEDQRAIDFKKIFDRVQAIQNILNSFTNPTGNS